MNLWVFIIAGAILWTVGDIFMQFWLDNHKMSLMIIGLILWTVGLVFLAHSFRFKHMAIASTLMMTVNSIFIILILWVFFKEPLTLTQIIGITFGLISLTLLEI